MRVFYIMSNPMILLGGMKKMEKKFDMKIFKKNPEELQQYLMFKKRGTRVENRKGKGSFKRKDKYPHRYEN